MRRSLPSLWPPGGRRGSRAPAGQGAVPQRWCALLRAPEGCCCGAGAGGSSGCCAASATLPSPEGQALAGIPVTERWLRQSEPLPPPCSFLPRGKDSDLSQGQKGVKPSNFSLTARQTRQGHPQKGRCCWPRSLCHITGRYSKV